MANLGELYYSLGVKEDKNLDKKLEDIKKKLSGLEFKITVDPSALATLTKLSTSAQALSDINKKLGMSSSQLASQQRQDAITAARTAAIQNTANNQTLLSQQRIATEAARTAVVNERLRQSVERAANAQKNLSEKSAFTNKTFTNQRVIAYQLANALGQAFSIYAVGAFIKKLAEVRGEFELQKVALQAIIRDTEKADKIFTQIKTLAVESPFQFKDLVSYTKQLAAFSIPAENLFDTMKRLADVSAGLGVDMGRITLAYGQVRAATVLRGQELRQFTEAGIPLVDKLAEKFSKLEGKTVSAGEVFERISNRMVSFKMVDQIFTDITSSGGMFFDMQKKQAETLAGKLSNLTDAYQIMLNSMGEKNQGTLKGGVDMLTNLMKNWESIATTLKVVIAAYGSYKVIMMATNAVMKFNNLVNAEAIVLQKAATLQMRVLSIEQARAAATTNVLATKMAGLNAITKANVWVAVIAAVVALGTYLYSAHQKAQQLDNDLRKIFNDTSGEATASITRMDLLMAKLKDANMYSQERAKIISELNSSYGQYLSNVIKESDSYEAIAESLKKATDGIYENAKAKAFAEGSRTIEESQKTNITEAEASIREVLVKSWRFSQQQSTDIIQQMFSSIRNNPEIIAQAGGLSKYMEKVIPGIGTSITDVVGIKNILGGLKQYQESIEITNIKNKDLRESINALSNPTKKLTGDEKLIADELAKSSKVYEDLANKITAKANADDSAATKRALATESLRNQQAALEETAKIYEKYNLQDKAREARQKAYDIDPLHNFAGQLSTAILAMKGFSDANKEMVSTLEQDKSMQEIKADFESQYEAAKKRLELLNKLAPELKAQRPVGELSNAKELVRLYKEVLETKFGGTSSKGDLKEEKKYEDRNKAIEELNKQYLQDHEDFANYDAGINAQRIAAMEDSMDKEFALNDLEYANRIKAIEKIKQVRLKELNEAAGIKIGSVGEIKDFTTKGLASPELQKLAEEGLAHDLKMRANAENSWKENSVKINKDWAYKIKEIQRDVNDAFKSGIDKERAALNEKYDDWARKAKLSGGIGSELGVEIERKRLIAMDELNKQYAIQRLDFEQEVQYRKNEIIANGFDRENKLNNLNFETYRAIQIKKARLLVTSTIPEEREKGALILQGVLADDNNKKLKDEEKQRQLILDISNKAVEGVRKYNSELADSLQLLSQAGLLIMKSAKEGLTPTEAYSAAIGGAMDLVGLVVNAAAQRKAEMKAYYDAVISQQLEYNLLLNDQLRLNSDIAGSVFIKDYEGRIADGVKALNDANSQLAKGMADFYSNEAIVDKKNVISGTNILSGVGAGAGMGAAIGSLVPVVGTAIGAAVGGIVGGLVGLFAKKKKDITAPLLETYPELIKANGEFNTELAKTLVADNLVTDATKKTLENLIAWQEAAEKARDQIKEVITDLAGSLGDDVRNSLVTAFTDGTDAAIAFGDSVDKVLENIISNMLFNAAFGDMFKKLQNDMNASVGLDENGNPLDPKDPRIDNSWVDDIVRFYDNSAKSIEAYNEALKLSQDELAARGISIFKPTTTGKTGLTGEIQGVTEDTSRMLASILNGVYGLVGTQGITLKSIEDVLVNTGSVTANSLAQLVLIQSNTYQMVQLLKSVIGGSGSQGDGIRVWTR